MMKINNHDRYGQFPAVVFAGNLQQIGVDVTADDFGGRLLGQYAREFYTQVKTSYIQAGKGWGRG